MDISHIDIDTYLDESYYSQLILTTFRQIFTEIFTDMIFIEILTDMIFTEIFTEMIFTEIFTEIFTQILKQCDTV